MGALLKVIESFYRDFLVSCLCSKRRSFVSNLPMLVLLMITLCIHILAKDPTSIVKTDSIPTTKGCIVTLSFGYDTLEKYDKTIILRNKSVRDHLYTIYTTTTGMTSAVADVIIFHEGNVWPTHQEYIQRATSDMPITFVNISTVFQDFHVVNNPLCPPSILSDQKNTPPGYNSMCYFWFVSFRDYVKQYDWMLRFDDDCVLGQNIRDNIHNLPSTVHFASPSWLGKSSFPLHMIPLTRFTFNYPIPSHVCMFVCCLVHLIRFGERRCEQI